MSMKFNKAELKQIRKSLYHTQICIDMGYATLTNADKRRIVRMYFKINKQLQL